MFRAVIADRGKGVTPEELQDAGVMDGTVRVSVGLKAIDDLTDDVDSALAVV
jgi:cystathionine beta-lyase/cystathionine gamma-synthase